MSKEKSVAKSANTSGAFPEQARAEVTNPPQSVLDTISEQAVVEQSQEKQEKRKVSLLPALGVEMFFNRSHLKRRVKVLIAVYCVIVFGAIAYGVHNVWQKNSELTQAWEQRETQYVQVLAGADLAELSEISAQFDSGVQTERDPVWSLFIIEKLAQETGVQLLNPSYTINSADSKIHKGIELSVLAHGTGQNIVTFLELILQTKPILDVQTLQLQPASEGSYQVTLYVEYLYTTKIDELVDEVGEKIDTGTQVDYPVAGAGRIIEKLETLRTIVMEKVGTFRLGKTDLFAS